jgi:hypothetical protein
MSDEIVFVDELPSPKKRPAVSEATIARLRAEAATKPDSWGRIAYEGDGLKSSTVRSRAVTLRNYAKRHGYLDNIEISERTEASGLAIYARWVDGKGKKK